MFFLLYAIHIRIIFPSSTLFIASFCAYRLSTYAWAYTHIYLSLDHYHRMWSEKIDRKRVREKEELSSGWLLTRLIRIHFLNNPSTLIVFFCGFGWRCSCARKIERQLLLLFSSWSVWLSTVTRLMNPSSSSIKMALLCRKKMIRIRNKSCFPLKYHLLQRNTKVFM